MKDDQNSSGAHKTALVALPLTFSDIVAQIEAEKLQRAALRPANKAAIFAALAGAGVVSVAVTFDGYGDSGQIESIDARDAASAALVLPDHTIENVAIIWAQKAPGPQPMTWTEAIEHLVYDALSETHGGWENNEGAYGEFVFDVPAQEIRLDYNERVTSTDFYSHTF
ncbi:MAG: hypothetical protein LCH39_01470 [Proteobacteria bacterium]|nr:hypothetical protein [Pseudomonadota bacterium]